VKTLAFRSGFVWVMVAAALLGASAPARGADAGKVELLAGESKSVQTDYLLGNVMVANPKVADLRRASDREVVIIGTGPGSTDVTLWDQQGAKRQEIRVMVGARDLKLYADQVRSLIGEIDGVAVRVVGSQLYVDGEVLREDDVARIEKVVAASPQVVNLVKLNPRAKEIMAQKIQQDIGTRGVSARVIRDNIVLEGIVYNKAAAERAEKIARAYSSQVVSTIEVRELVTPPPPPNTRTVQVKATFMEVSRSVIDSFGIQWAPGIAVDATGSGTFQTGAKTNWAGSVVGTLSSLFPKFRAAAEKGQARIIEEPTVVTRSGEKGTFFSGGEVAFPVVQADGGITNEWKQFGVSLNVEPTLVDDTSVDLKIEVEVSSLGKLSGSAPSLTKSTVKTTQIVKGGDSVVLGGLISATDRKTFNKVPDGASSGSLWQLFRSKDFQEDKTELVVFVTPVITQSAAQAGLELKERVEKGFNADDAGQSGRLR
jgi:pilus assembly protein CpaC